MAQRPYVFVNMAMTADGKIDTVERRGARISGPADTARVDGLRAASDAVMVGSRTLLAEDPRLTVRRPELVADRVRAGKPAQPAKVGVISRLEPPGDGRLRTAGDFFGDGFGRVVLCTTTRSEPHLIARYEELGAHVLVAGDERVDLAAALAGLKTMGIARLMVEGGSTLVAALLEGGLVDELQLAIAPMVFGGASAPTPVGGLGRSRTDAIGLQLTQSGTSADGDVILHYQVAGAARS